MYPSASSCQSPSHSLHFLLAVTDGRWQGIYLSGPQIVENKGIFPSKRQSSASIPRLFTVNGAPRTTPASLTLQSIHCCLSNETSHACSLHKHCFALSPSLCCRIEWFRPRRETRPRASEWPPRPQLSLSGRPSPIIIEQRKKLRAGIRFPFVASKDLDNCFGAV